MIVARLIQIFEGTKRSGPESLAGRAAERACQRDLAAYFRRLTAEIKQYQLEKLVATSANVQTARHAVEMQLANVLRRHSPDLVLVLVTNTHDALLKADKQTIMHEAASKEFDKVGLTAQQAADYAATHAAQAVAGINATTQQQIADIIATGIEEQQGVGKVARLLRGLFADMSTSRASTIAATEMADAFGEAAMLKLNRIGASYKQLILSGDACPICEGIEENGPVPLNEPFVDDDGEEYDRSPIHPNCRCATVGARAPKEE